MAEHNQEFFVFTCCTGSDGNVGGHGARALHSRATKEGRKFKIRLAARNTEKAKKEFTDLGDSVEVVYMDLKRPETFSKALEGASAVFLGEPDFGGLDTKELVEAFIDAVEKTESAPFIVRIVGGALSPTMRSLCNETGCKLLDHHIMAVEAFQSARREGRLQASIVDAHAGFFQNYSGSYFSALVKAGEIAIPNGNVLLRHIDTRDVGEFVAAVMLGKSKYYDKDFVLTGGCKLTTSDWADLISKATGRKIVSSEDETPLKEAFSAISIGPGVHLWDILKPFFEVERLSATRENMALHPEVYESITGKKYRLPEDFCTEMAKKSCWSAK